MTALTSYPIGKHFFITTGAFSSSFLRDKFKARLLTEVNVMLAASIKYIHSVVPCSEKQ